MWTRGPAMLGAVGDPYFANTVLLTHFDGALTDIAGHALSADGTSFTSTNAKFSQSLNVGGTSPGGGGTNVVYSTGTSADWDLNASDFTIEGWMWFNADPTRPRTLIRIADDSSSSGADEYMLYNAGAGRNFYFTYPGGTVNDSVTVPLNSWIHLAAVRIGNAHKLFVGGAETSGPASASRAGSGSKQLFIGNSRRGFVDGHDGMIDDVRVTKGVARYTASFTPPAAPFADA